MSKKQELEQIKQTTTMSRDDVMQMLGAARYAEWLADQSASHVMQFLMTVQEQKLYLATDDKTFVDFLERSGLKKKSVYYNHRSLLLNEGPDLFDLMEEWGVPMATRRLLTSGDIRVDGKDVFIGEEKLDPGSPTIAKQVIEQLVKDKIKVEKIAADATAKLEKTTRRLEHEQNALDDLRAEYDKAMERTPFEAAMGELLTAAMQLGDIVRYMDPEERDQRAETDIKAIDLMLHELKDAYGVAEWQLMMKKAAG